MSTRITNHTDNTALQASVTANEDGSIDITPASGQPVNVAGQLIASAALAAKATGAEINTGTDDAKFATPKAIRDSKIAQGVAAAYKIARGEHTQVAASDTVVTGLATVISIVVSPRARTVKQLFFNASPGDQAGTPAAGSVLITSQKPTAVNDVTPIPATDFTDNIVVDWVAVGT